MAGTGNPIGSTAFADFEYNVGVAVDNWANSTDNTVLLRTINGVQREVPTLNGIVQQGQDAIQAIQDDFDAAQAGQFVADSEAAADRAETAADVAMTAGLVYPDVASGEAARSDGEYFWVVSAEDTEVLELWLMNATTATDTGKRTASKSSVSVVVSQTGSIDLGNLISDVKIRRATGEVVSDSYWSSTDFIKVYKDQIIVIDCWSDGPYGGAFYDENLEYLAPVDIDNTTWPQDSLTTSYHVEVPEGATYIRISCNDVGIDRFSATKENSVIKDSEVYKAVAPYVISERKHKAVYVDGGSGDDSNDGTDARPLSTISAGLQKVSETGGDVIVAGGDYYETLQLSALKSGRVSVKADFNVRAGDADVRIMCSSQITGFTKTSGYTNLYSATFAGTIPLIGNNSNYGKRIFEDRTQSVLISSADRHALQRNQSHRLPFAEIKEIQDQGSLNANLAYLDSLPAGESGYWHDVSNDVLYVVNASHSDVSASSIHTHARNATDLVPGTGLLLPSVDFYMQDISFHYSDNPVWLREMGFVSLWNVSSFGARETAFDDTGSHSILTHIESGGAGRDGLANQLYFPQPNQSRHMERFNEYKGVWLHDCYDDGFSTHQNGANSIENFLIEYCGTGIQHVNATYATMKNGLIRKSDLSNLRIDGSADTYDRYGTVIEATNVTSEDSKYNFEANVGSGNNPAIMRLVNCVSRGASIAGYRAKGSNAIINAENCKTLDDAAAKAEQDGGAVNVTNDNDLV